MTAHWIGAIWSWLSRIHPPGLKRMLDCNDGALLGELLSGLCRV